MAARLDSIAIESREFWRLERLQNVLIARQNEPVRSKLEGIDLLVTGAIFFQHLASGIGGACARQLDLDIRIFAFETIDERFDLRAGCIEQEGAFPLGAGLQHGWP